MILRNRCCSNCAWYSAEYDNAGICQGLGAVTKRGETIIDGLDIFKKLSISKLEYRHPIVRKGFRCIYYKQGKGK